MAFIHTKPEWPRFTWDRDKVPLWVSRARHKQGMLLGRMEALGFPLQAEKELDSLTLEVVKSSEIEGENLPAEQVRSSLAKKLGIEAGGVPVADRRVEGVVEMMVDATQGFDQPLTAERLWRWHASLFKGETTGIKIGAWRQGPMQVVSGPAGRPRVHFEAPEADRLGPEMAEFLAWENPDGNCEPVLKAALAHLWFVTIHPFDDGNGRIARAIADRNLARADGSPRRFYSMSAQIRDERKDYYEILERTQRGPLDVTEWIAWFLSCLERALDRSGASLAGVLKRGAFWQTHAALALNERQRKVLGMLLDRFEGKLTSTKWAALTKCSQDTATRDINRLIELGLLKKDEGGGRSTSYSLVS